MRISKIEIIIYLFVFVSFVFLAGNINAINQNHEPLKVLENLKDGTRAGGIECTFSDMEAYEKNAIWFIEYLKNQKKENQNEN